VEMARIGLCNQILSQISHLCHARQPAVNSSG
jgi:hypothetical protein